MNRDLAREKARALVAQMTLEEAASQLRYDAPAIDRLGVPAYNWWNEALHGVARGGMATSFPQAIGIAAAFDTELTEALGDIAATEGRAKYNAASAHGDRDIYKGLTFWSPNINIFRDPRWGRGHETYGEDPFLTAEMGCAYVRGLQGNGETMKAAACAKHFAVHSGPESLRHEFDAVAGPKDMNETYLPAFERLVKEAKVESVMGAYNRTNGEPCCGSHTLLQKTLREKWGFEGHVVSDCWAIADFHMYHHITDTPEESAQMAIENGCDVNCGVTYQYLLKALEKGMVTEAQIRLAAERLFTTRYVLGIMGEGSEFDAISFDKVECAEHLKKAHEAAVKSCVLLKNDGLLPLKAEALKTVGVIGPNANSRAALVGNYHGTSSRYITILEGLQDALGDGVRVLASEGCHLFRDKVENLGMVNDRISEAVTVAENSDAVVLVVGLDETLEGEQGDTGNSDASGDKLDLLLPKTQRILMDAVLAVGKPTVIVLMAGSSIDLGEAGEKANAVLLSWYPGARGGKAVAELLLGKASPSGKLPLTFYHNDQLAIMPDFTDYSMKGRTYRFFEHEPLYPFGYGLTYGDVYVHSAKAEEKDGAYTVTAVVENAGSVCTQDVVQVYVQNHGSENAPANPRLCAFRRISCPAGEKVEVSIPVPAEALKVINESGDAVLEGKLAFYVGMGQPDSRTETLTGRKAVRIDA